MRPHPYRKLPGDCSQDPDVDVAIKARSDLRPTPYCSFCQRAWYPELAQNAYMRAHEVGMEYGTRAPASTGPRQGDPA